MIRINYVNLPSKDVILIDYDGTIGEFIADTFHPGDGFSIYYDTPCIENDITLKVLEGIDIPCHEYTVADTPSAGLTVAGWIAVISLVISVAAIALAPKPKIPATINRSQESPNNALGARSNQPRPLQRVPDIKGTVKSIPDVIMPPYYKYIDLRTRVEHGYYCVGRKQLQIEDIKDGDTPISLIEGASAQVYYPNKSPNNALPDVQIGDFIDLPVYVPYRSNEVDGIALPAINDIGSTPMSGNLYYFPGVVPTYGSKIWTFRNAGASGSELTMAISEYGFELSPDYYIGNTIILESFLVDFTEGTQDLSGEYTIVDVSRTDVAPGILNQRIVIDFPYPSASTPAAIQLSAQITTKFYTPYNQWYYMTRAEVEQGFVNVTAPNGIYRDTGSSYPLALTTEFEVEVEPVDADGTPSGSSTIYTGSISGNSTIKRGVSVDFTLPYATRYRCRVRRTTARNTGSGTVMDEIKWEDLYALDNVDLTDFGNVTTIQTRTIATPFATAVKDRQLNCIAAEMLYAYQGAGVFSGTLTANNTAVQSYISDFIDPQLGNRPISELDADGLLTLNTSINNYFGSTAHGEFNFTLDSTDITFQEYTFMLFNAINCVAYRDGSTVKAHFEKPVTIPARLFTHRSKIPNTETYSRNLNYSQLPDGVEFKWIDPVTNTQEVIYLPADRTAVAPKKFEMAGFRNYDQAYKRAYREYNKILNEKIVLDVEITADGRDIKPGDVVSVVKGTRTNTADGEVLAVSVDGYTLTLSQDVNFVPLDTHSIILKKDNGDIEAITCTAGTESNRVVLSSLPTEAIRTGIDYQRRTEFSFGNDAKHTAQMYIARSIDISNKHTVQLKCVNYTDNYYANDSESLNGFDSGFDEGFS